MAHQSLRVTLFGTPIVTLDGRRLDVPSRKGLALILYLAVEGRPVARADVAELLWGEGRLDNLRQELSKLRRLPGADRWLDASELVEVHADTDVAAFERAVGSRDHERALGQARAGFLEDFPVPRGPFYEWVEGQRERLEALMRTARKGRAETLAGAGRIAEAIEHLHRAVELDPLDESAHRRVMRLEFMRGNLQAALEQYETIRRSLHQELGLAPIAATQELANLIQHGNATVARPERPTRIPPRLMRPIALVGRDREWERLERAWRDKKAMILMGPPGIGKTRLMLDFARSRGRYLLNEGHATDAAFPLSTLARGLQRARQPLATLSLDPCVRSALARLAPEAVSGHADGHADTPVRMSIEDAWFYFMRALKTKIDSLAADDIHWFDSTSAHVAESVHIRFSREEPPSWRHVATLRPEEADPGVLERIAQGAAFGINEVIELRPLDVAGVHDLLAMLEVPGAGDLSEPLHRYAGGNPMFTLETLRTMYETGRLEPEVATFEVPGRVEVTMERRLDALDPASLRTLRAVAVVHPNATPELLAAMLSETPVAVAEAMGELERSQWLHEAGFLHDLGYEVVVRHMPETVRTFLHRRAAMALEAMGADEARIEHHRASGGTGSERRKPSSNGNRTGRSGESSENG